jgi:hypothetical protein
MFFQIRNSNKIREEIENYKEWYKEKIRSMIKLH